MIAGSGFLKYSTQNTYRTGATRAGTTFYVLDVATGNVLATRDVGADASAETVDDCRAANDCRNMKNALQMDPVASGVGDQRFVTKVYVGDLDGNLWKFALSRAGAGGCRVASDETVRCRRGLSALFVDGRCDRGFDESVHLRRNRQ